MAFLTVGPTDFNLTTPYGLGTTEMYIPDEFDVPESIGNIFVPIIVTSVSIGVVANLLAVYITVKCAKENHERKLTIPGLLVRALLITDTSASLFFFLRGLLVFLYRRTFFQCDVDMAGNLVFSWASGLVILLMSCDRFLALAAPFFYHEHATRGKAYLMLGISVLLAAVLSLLPVFGFGAYKIYVKGKYHCLAPGDLQAKATDFDSIFTVLFFSVGLGILVICYAANAVVLWQILKLKKRLVVVHNETLKGQTTSNGDLLAVMENSKPPTRAAPKSDLHTVSGTRIRSSLESGISADGLKTEGIPSKANTPRPSLPRPSDPGKREVRFGAMILVFSAVFTLSWLPFYIQRLVRAFTGSTSHLSLMIVICLITLNHVIDPFVYVLMKVQYRKKLKQLYRRWRSLICRRCRGNTGTSDDREELECVSSGEYDGRNLRKTVNVGLTGTTGVSALGLSTASLVTETPAAPLIHVTAASPSVASELSQVDPTRAESLPTDSNYSIS